MDIIWQQAGKDFTIRLLAPMGAGNYLIQGEKDFAEIRFPDGEKQIVDNVDQVFKSALEVDLPVSAVKDWIRGLPAGVWPVDSIEWNTKGLIDRIKQSGWNVEMKKYTGGKILIPYNIYLSRDDDPDLGIRLILRQWLVDN
jgi:outer membrane lipoprotein LolB